MQFKAVDIVIQVCSGLMDLRVRVPFLKAFISYPRASGGGIGVNCHGTSRLSPTNFLNSFSEHAPHALPCSIPMISITRRTLGIPRALNADAADSVAL